MRTAPRSVNKVMRLEIPHLDGISFNLALLWAIILLGSSL